MFRSMIYRINNQRGVAQFLVIAIMAFLALGLPATTKLVQQNQENRSKAAEDKIIPATGITMDLENPIHMGVGETLIMKYHLIPANSTDKITWSVTKGSDIVMVDTNGLVKALKSGEADILGLTSTNKQFAIQTVSVTEKLTNQNPALTKTLTPTASPMPTSNAYLYFNPQNQSYKLGDTFEVIAGVDSVSNIIGGVDIIGTFDSSKLELISINKSPAMVFGNEGECSITKDFVTERFALSCFDNDNLQTKKIKGDLVKLTFKAKSTGSAKIQFVCQKNSTQDSNIIGSNIPNDLIACDKNVNANITITSNIKETNGVCGPLKANQVIPNIDKEKPQLLCKSGKVDNFTKTSDAYWWNCVGINGGESIGCGFDNPDTKKTINGACGSVKFSQLTSNSDKNTPELLCKSGRISDFGKMSPNCSKNSDSCPPSTYTWKCLGSNGGKNVKCTVKQNTTITPTPKSNIPATNIKISPLGLTIKIGQKYNLTYILSPKNSTDTINWSTTGNGQAKIQKVTLKCTSGTNCNSTTGINYLQITGLKAGTTKVTLTATSGQKATFTLVIKK